MQKSDYIEFETAGEILAEILEDNKISRSRLAKATGVPAGTLALILAGKRKITAETGLRISLALGMSSNVFFGLQVDYDKCMAQRKLEMSGVRIESLIPPRGNEDLPA